MIRKAELPVNFVDELHNALDLILDLLFCHKDVRVVLREVSHTHKSVQRS